MIRNAILAVAGIALVASGAFAAQPVSQQDSAGGDATDTVNHAVNVNVVAGGGSTTITGPLGSNTIAQSLAVTASDGSIVTLGHISDTISTPSLMGYNLGSKTDLDSILASLATPAPTYPNGYTSTDGSGSLTAGTTASFTTILASSSTRHDCTIQNPSTATEVIYIHSTTASPTTANSFTLTPGSTFKCAGGGIVITDAISASAATNPHPYVLVSQ
jgi:hypothetical protein